MPSMPSSAYFLTFFKTNADICRQMPTVGEYPTMLRDHMCLLNGLQKVEKDMVSKIDAALLDKTGT